MKNDWAACSPFHVGQTFNDAKRAYAGQIQQWESIIEQVADLFMRMKTKQAEVAATVYFAAQESKNCEEQPLTERDVLATVMKWKQKRRPPLEEKEVAMTVRHLNMLNWITAKASTDLPITEEEVLHV